MKYCIRGWDMDIEDVHNGIENIHNGLHDFWSQSDGWAPIEAVKLLDKSRLDWQLSLAKKLKYWNQSFNDDDYANLILGWTTLGSLVEGILKLALSVYYNDYKKDSDYIIGKKNKMIEPDSLMLGKLREFCNGKLWDKSEEWNDWILKIQERRNAIHAYKDRDLGDFIELQDNIAKYLEFVIQINDRLPYPDYIFAPRFR